MPRSTASSTSTAASRRARRAGNHKPPKSSRGADADPALRSPLARVAEKHGVEVVIKFLSTSARARAVTLDACRCALERACDASATRAKRVLLALEIAFRDFTGAMARYACPDVEDAGRRQLLKRVVGIETSRDDDASTSSVVLPGQDDTLASWLRATVASNGREGAGKDDEVEDDASSVGTSATSRDLDGGGRADAGPIFGELYARCQYANALLQAAMRARALFDDVDVAALKPGTSMESARVEWRRCASAFRAAQCEGEAFLSAMRGQSWIKGASLELSRAPEADRAAIELTLTHMRKRATIGLTLALERWNRLVQTYARDMRDNEGELAMKMKQSLREFLRTYDVTGVDMSTKDIDDVERIREHIELGGRVREFLLNAINEWHADFDIDDTSDITTFVVEKVDGTVDRALKAFAVRAESNERDAHLDFTNHLLLEASWAFRRARLVVADAAFGEDVASFDHARSAAATNALLVGENLARLRA